MSAIKVRKELPTSTDVIQLLKSSDAYMKNLYPSDSNHLLSLDELMNPNVIFLVAREENIGIGCGAIILNRPEYAEIKRMYVDQTGRGRGVGKLVLEALIDQSKECCIQVMRLETGIAQHEAIGLYKSYGFYEIYPFGEYKSDPLSLFMEKRL